MYPFGAIAKNARAAGHAEEEPGVEKGVGPPESMEKS